MTARGGRVEDLVAVWSSDRWLAYATAWIARALADRGAAITGPIERSKVRFWGTALTVPTDAGLAWFKASHPAQAFEAALVERLGRIAPAHVLPALAIDPARGWLLTPDQGQTLAQRAGDPRDHRVRVVREFAALQRLLAEREREVVATGLTVIDPAAAAARMAAHIDALAALPPGHPFALDPDLSAAARARLPVIDRAAGVLASARIPLSLEHNDLHDNNAFVASEAAPLRFFDFGDAVWGHPFTSLFIPLSQVLADDDPGDPRDDPHGQALIAAYLEPWADLAQRDELEDILDAALVLGHVHKLESWWRLARTTPAQQLEPYRGVQEYLRADRFELRSA